MTRPGPAVPYGHAVRIVHVSDCYAPRTGGMETQVRALAHQQAFRGDHVSVITATPGDGATADGPLGLHRVSVKLPGDLPVHPRARGRVASIVQDVRPDVVHIHVGEVSPFAWGAIRAVVGTGTPLVVTVHSVWSRLFGACVAPLGRGWAASPTVVTAVSRMAANLVEGALRVPVSVIPNGIDTDVWHPRQPVAHQGVRFVAVQRLAPRKRTSALIRAFAAACAFGSPLQLDIIGDGPQRLALEHRVRTWGREDAIHFLGRRTGEEIRETFARSDVFVQASRRESFGIAALEARASGLPIVAFRDSGTADFVRSGVEGILVRDDTCLARAIRAIGSDGELRSMLTSHNVTVPVSQAWQQVIPVVDEAYERARDLLRLSA